MRLISADRNRAALVDNLFARFARRIAANPSKHEPYLAIGEADLIPLGPQSDRAMNSSLSIRLCLRV
jgi:hypothetical protein